MRARDGGKRRYAGEEEEGEEEGVKVCKGFKELDAFTVLEVSEILCKST